MDHERDCQETASINSNAVVFVSVEAAKTGHILNIASTLLGVMGTLIWGIKIVTLHISPLMVTHEPPSEENLARRCLWDRQRSPARRLAPSREMLKARGLLHAFQRRAREEKLRHFGESRCPVPTYEAYFGPK